MMFTVLGTRTQQISVEVEADSAVEAVRMAKHQSYVDVWDQDTEWYGVAD